MKKYHVYGIGNALVDMEFKVEDQFLESLNIDKGVMTLVNADQQNALYNSLKGLKGKKASGGSAANTVIAISHFGGNAFYSCKVANDDTGGFYVKDLESAGVTTNLQSQRENGISGKCIVMVTPDAERTMHTFLGISETVSSKELNPDAISASEYLYLEGYLVTSPTGRAAAVEARNIAEAKGTKTALTFSDPNMVEFFRDGLAEMIGDGVDLLFCNEQEALTWSGKNQVGDAANALKDIAKSFAITLGNQGALIYDGNELFKVDAVPANAVDTNGAGDIFAGAFLYSLTHGQGFQSAGNFASQAASRLVSQFGPRLEPEQYKGLIENSLGTGNRTLVPE